MYVRVPRGQSCVQAGHAFITTAAECGTAAAATNFGDTPARSIRAVNVPRGCWVSSDLVLYFNSVTSSTMTNFDMICRVIPREHTLLPFAIP